MLHAHPAVADVLVVGVPDERWGSAVTAVVQPAPGATPTLDDARRPLPARTSPATRSPSTSCWSTRSCAARPARPTTAGPATPRWSRSPGLVGDDLLVPPRARPWACAPAWRSPRGRSRSGGRSPRPTRSCRAGTRRRTPGGRRPSSMAATAAPRWASSHATRPSSCTAPSAPTSSSNAAPASCTYNGGGSWSVASETRASRSPSGSTAQPAVGRRSRRRRRARRRATRATAAAGPCADAPAGAARGGAGSS